MSGEFIVTIGVPGSGKSTWADKTPGFRLERDRMREALWGGRKAYFDDPQPIERKSFVMGSALYAAMRAALTQSLTDRIVMSDTGFGWNSVARFWNLARDYRWHCSVVVFDVPLELLLVRNEMRPEDQIVPEDYIRKCYNEMWRGDAWWRGAPLRAVVNEEGEICEC